MIKKALIIGGLGLFGFGLYRYFKYQVDLAMDYNYKIKKFEYLGVKGDDVNVSATIQITNNSNFQLTINSFDLDLFFEGKKFADVVSTQVVVIQPKTSFDIKGIGVINVNDLKTSLPVFVKDVLNQKPIDIEVEGQLKINFMKIDSTIVFNREKFNYSTDLISEYGLNEKYTNLKNKYSKIFSAIGIK